MVHDAISKAHQEFRPLVDVALRYRNEKLGVKAPKRTYGEVKIDSWADCEGLALADASRFQSFCPKMLDDETVYKEWYGVSPSYVWEQRESRTFVKVLDM